MAKSELIDGYASGLDYVRQHKTISLLLLLQIKVRTEKFLLSPITREVKTIT